MGQIKLAYFFKSFCNLLH